MCEAPFYFSIPPTKRTLIIERHTIDHKKHQYLKNGTSHKEAYNSFVLKNTSMRKVYMPRDSRNNFLIDVYNLDQNDCEVLSHSSELKKNFYWVGLGDRNFLIDQFSQKDIFLVLKLYILSSWIYMIEFINKCKTTLDLMVCLDGKFWAYEFGFEWLKFKYFVWIVYKRSKIWI